MSVSSVLRAAVAKGNMTQKEMAEALEMPAQTFRNKLTRNSFSAKDLIIMANTLNCKLVFLKKSDNEIFETFSIEDAKE